MTDDGTTRYPALEVVTVTSRRHEWALIDVVRCLIVRALSVVTWAAALVGSGSCSASSVYGVELLTGQLSVRVAESHLILDNQSTEAVHYVVVEEEESRLIDLAPPEEWPRLPPGTATRIAYVDVLGYEPGDEQARVYWWTESSGSGHLVTDLR